MSLKTIILSLFSGLLVLKYPGRAFSGTNHPGNDISIMNDTLPFPPEAGDNLLVSLMKRDPAFFQPILSQPDTFRVQIIYTSIQRNKSGKPSLSNHRYRLDPNEYFYPASTIKLPVAILAMEKMRDLGPLGINRNTCMVTRPAGEQLPGHYNEPNALDGRPSIDMLIRKLFLVSDNDAYNRLYEFIGQEEINQRLQTLGFPSAEIRHRLDVSISEAENRIANAIDFYGPSGNLMHQVPERRSACSFTKRSDRLGNAYYRGNDLVMEPMDFSNKNRMGLADLHETLLRLVLPETVEEHKRFRLLDEDRSFLLKVMSQFPNESVYPSYPEPDYGNGYAKFILPEDASQTRKNPIRSINKSGMAYGHLLDVAYVFDEDTGVEFFLSAIIYCNRDGILNDDVYEYEETGFPFFKRLGQLLYQYERERKRPLRADFSELIFSPR